MNANVTHLFPDEPPTSKIENVPSRTLTTLARIDRLAAVAAERLAVDPDADAIVAALEDLAQLRALAGALIR
jgi:hypothetical protein